MPLTIYLTGEVQPHQLEQIKAAAPGADVRYFKTNRELEENVDELFSHDRLHEFLGQSDFVVVTAPRTPETAGMLGEAEFRAMKPSAYYVCFSRGGIAEDGALLRALREGWIAGAGLDAHAREPLPADSPFWDLPNVVITPHNAASSRAVRERGI